MDESWRQQAPLSGKPLPELGWKLGMWAGYETPSDRSLEAGWCAEGCPVSRPGAAWGSHCAGGGSGPQLGVALSAKPLPFHRLSWERGLEKGAGATADPGWPSMLTPGWAVPCGGPAGLCRMLAASLASTHGCQGTPLCL